MATLGLVALLAPAGLAAQQDTARVDTARIDEAPVDTLPFGAPGIGAPGPDTLPADTTPTLRERALRRLRALPLTPVQPDTTAVDTAAADTTAVDTVGADTAAVAAPADAPGDTLAGRPPPDTVRGDVPVEGEPVPAPGDSLALFTGEPGDTADRVMAEDDVLAQLRAMPGYVATDYTGDRAVFVAGTNELELTGEARITREGRTLETDSLIVYDGQERVVCGYGAPVLSGDAEPIESDEVCFDIDRDLGMARGARTEFQQGATWYVRGADNRVYVLTGTEKNTLYGEAAEFTSCDLDHPHYSFRAKSLKMVEDEMMVARDVTLKFADVPVFWLPWMVQSMKRDRRSGLLMPEFGVNDIVRNSTGYNRHLSNLGFYWAMNDYMSAKGTFEWYSGNWTAVEGALTYRWLRQFLQGDLTAKHYWRQSETGPGRREFTLNTSNGWQPDERTRLQLNANYASSTDFVRRNSFDPRELNRRITSSASVNRSFGWGSMSLGAQRQQQLSTDQVDLTLPSLSLTVSPMTLYSNGEGLDLTWSGRGQTRRRTVDVVEDTTNTSRDSESLTASASHSLSFGRLSLGQSVDYDQSTKGARPAPTNPDSMLSETVDESIGWNTSLSYQQNLWTGTSLSPSLSISGRLVRDSVTELWSDSLGTGSGSDFVSEPYRLSAGASLSTAIYGFWPGFAGFSRIRHKIAPSINWQYSPKPRTSELQDSIFGLRSLREQNRISLSFNQTFEAKREEDETADTVAVDTTAAEDGGPRRLPQAEKIMLLSLTTAGSFVYDFVSAREEGRGFLTEQISNSIQSDLLEGLQLSMTHDLFEEGPFPVDESGQAIPDALRPRKFDPFLTRLTASFSIDNDFWLFRALGLSAGADEEAEEEEPPEAEGVAGSEDAAVGAEADPDRTPGGIGSVVPPGRVQDNVTRPGVGRWNASLNYSFQRQRPIGGVSPEANQMVRGNFSFDPTEKWSVRWSTSYSFTDGEFADHVLTLSRDLHRWQANFHFIKAQNGNFALQFRVSLSDNPDLKLDYDQRTDPSQRRVAR